MSFARSVPPLSIAADPRWAGRLVIAAHAVAGLVLLLQPLAWSARIALLPICAAIAYYTLRRLRRASPARIALDRTGSWQIQCAGRWRPARLIAAQRLPGLLWLRWCSAGGTREAWIPAGDATVRRLRARLRLGEGTGDELAG